MGSTLTNATARTFSAPVRASAVVAIILTVVTMIVVLIVLKQVVFWYYYPVAIIVGLMVAYGAMFGYDNLYREIAKVIGNTNKEDKKE